MTRLLGIRVVPQRQLPRGLEPVLYEKLGSLPANSNTGPVVFDIGANSGDTTREILDLFPNATVHAFEPAPPMFQVFKKAWGSDSRVRCNQTGMSSQTGSLPFEVREDDPFLSRIVSPEEKGAVIVPVDTVDDYAARNGIDFITLLKSDTEGHELEVLGGARRMLLEGKIAAILIEVSPGPPVARSVALAKIQEALTPWGYELFGLYDFGYNEKGRLRYCNALFKHSSVFSMK